MMTLLCPMFQRVSFDYGMKNKNPIDHVRFYRKSDPDTAIKIGKDEASMIMPSAFHEQYVRLYCKSRDPVDVEAAKECFSQWREKCNPVTSSVSKSISHQHFR